MLKRTLILFILVLAPISCTAAQEEEGGFRPLSLDDEARQEFERVKREVLNLEDLKVGTGPVAAWGRKITADVVIRYVGSGTVVYQGPVLIYWGMDASVTIHNSLREPGALSMDQTGIRLGLNGMAVGGKRLITIPPKLVCAFYGSEKADPGISCLLVKGSTANAHIRKEALNVEATLTGSCIPLHRGRSRGKEDVCRDADLPKRNSSDPIWHFY
jgi:hypothetical protein